MKSISLATIATTLVWACVGAIAGIAVLGVHLATAQSPTAKLPPAIDGWRTTIRYDSKVWPTMKFTVSFTNVEKQAREVRAVAKLVKSEFKGNPMSRVVLPNDQVESDLETKSLSGSVAAGKTTNLALNFKTKLETKEKATIGMPRTSYVVVIESGGKELARIGVRPAPSPARGR